MNFKDLIVLLLLDLVSCSNSKNSSSESSSGSSSQSRPRHVPSIPTDPVSIAVAEAVRNAMENGTDPKAAADAAWINSYETKYEKGAKK